MTSEQKHTGNIHIDAPVEKVFTYIAEPAHFIGAMPAENRASVGEVTRNPDGTVAGYEVKTIGFGIRMTLHATREEFVANERVTDHVSLGVDHKLSVAPDGDGTMLTYSWDGTTLMKLAGAVSHADKDIDVALAAMKREVEALA